MVEKTHTAGWWPQFYEPLKSMSAKIADWFAPAADAAATQEHYEINMELPGVKSDDIEIAVNDNTLTIKGEKRFEREQSGRSYFFSEREYGAFQRSFRLPAHTEADAITANFKDGVLTVKVPKAGPPPDRSKKIEVRAG